MPRSRRNSRDLSDEANELLLFVETDGELMAPSRSNGVPTMGESIRRNLAQKMAKGTYSSVLANKAWTHLADSGARKYAWEQYERPRASHWSAQKYPAWASASVRREVGAALARDFEALVEADPGYLQQLLAAARASRKRTNGGRARRNSAFEKGDRVRVTLPAESFESRNWLGHNRGGTKTGTVLTQNEYGVVVQFTPRGGASSFSQDWVSHLRGGAGRKAATNKVTMADIKAASLERGSPYFSRGSTKFFGGDKYWGPYTGPGGVYFVQHNHAGYKVKQANSDGSISSVSDGYPSSREEASAVARAMARGER